MPQHSKQNGIFTSLLAYSAPSGEEKALAISVVISINGLLGEVA